MKYVLIPILLTAFSACKSDTLVYSGDFEGLSENADKMNDWDIVLRGYLSKSDTVPDRMGAPIILYETREALAAELDINNGVLVSIGDKDASACYGKRVKLTGKILSYDQGRVFLKASEISKSETASEAKKYTSCFQ